MDTIEVIKNWIDKESSVLDLGCGDGEILNILSKEWGSTVLGVEINQGDINKCCLLYTSPSPRDATLSRMPSSA